jgi:hypothetical protein
MISSLKTLPDPFLGFNQLMIITIGGKNIILLRNVQKISSTLNKCSFSFLNHDYTEEDEEDEFKVFLFHLIHLLQCNHGSETN